MFQVCRLHDVSLKTVFLDDVSPVFESPITLLEYPVSGLPPFGGCIGSFLVFLPYGLLTLRRQLAEPTVQGMLIRRRLTVFQLPQPFEGQFRRECY